MMASLASLREVFESPPPDGWFHRNLLWFGESLGPATVLARGARMQLPDLKSADDATRETYAEALGTFFTQLGESEAVKFHWQVDADYTSELEAYARQSAVRQARGWCAAVRQERHRRYVERMIRGGLRRERLDIYLSKRCATVPSGGFRNEEQIERYLEQTALGFAERLRQLEGRWPGSRLELWGDQEHFAAWRSFCQPGTPRLGAHRFDGFDPTASILDNCWPGGGVTTRDEEGHVFFRMDGLYHTLLVLRRWPMETHAGVIWPITGALAGNYCYTLTCLPLDPQREIARTEEEMRRLRGSRQREGKESLDDVLVRKKAKISALQTGFARPFAALAVLRAWHPTLEGLQARVQALRESVTAAGGATCHQVEQEVQAKRLFYETLPGWTGGSYRDWDLFALAGRDPRVCFLQDLVPLSSSYTGHAESGEALYDGEEANLVGIRTFAEDTPQHAVMIGTTRVGKSSQVIDYLSQTDCFFAFRGIIEEGMSYGTLVKLLEGESIVLHPDGDVVINYFDTQGAPLSRSHLAMAAGLLLVMAGRAADPEANAQRKAMLGEYVEQLLTDAWEDRRRKRPEAELEAARWALLLEERRREAAARHNVASRQELFSDLRAFATAEPGRWAETLRNVSEGRALAFAREQESAAQVRDVGLAFLPAEEFPTHTALLETLKYNRMPHHDRTLTDRLAAALAPWQRHGPHGRLFDGITNCALQARVVHFELGLLPAANAEMKEAAVYLVANRLRQKIVSLPRALRKQFIFEEPSRYLQVGGMEELLAEFYAQMGKFGCHILPVTQQYGQLSRSALRPVIFGNSKQYFLFKQNDRHDLDEIGEAIGLPSAARAAIRGFTAPEYQHGADKFSQMAVFSIEGERSACGVVRNHATREMRYVSDSSGATFDARSRALAAHADLLEGVRIEASRQASGQGISAP